MSGVNVNELSDDEAKQLYEELSGRLQPRIEYWVQDLMDAEMHGNCQICGSRYDLKTAVWLHVGDRRYPERGSGALLLCEAHWMQALRYIIHPKHFGTIFTQEPVL